MNILLGISSRGCKENKPIFSTMRLATVIGKNFVVLPVLSNCEAMRILSYRTEAKFLSKPDPSRHETASQESMRTHYRGAKGLRRSNENNGQSTLRIDPPAAVNVK